MGRREQASRERGAEGGRELTFGIAVSHCDGEVGLLWRWLMEDGRGIFGRQKRGMRHARVCVIGMSGEIGGECGASAEWVAAGEVDPAYYKLLITVFW